MRINLVFPHRVHQNVHTVYRFLTSFSNVDAQSRKGVHTKEGKSSRSVHLFFAFRWCFLYAEHRVFLPHRNALNERQTHCSSFLESLSNSCVSLLVVAIFLHHHKCTDVLERPLYDVKLNGFQQQCPATLASFSSFGPTTFGACHPF